MRDAAMEADREVRAASECYRLGDPAAAESHCRQALFAVPGHRDGTVFLGIALLAQSRFGEAEAVFTGLTVREPQDAAHWSNLGTARRGGRHWDEALTAYARAAALGAGSADFYYNIGLTHLDRLDFEAARAVLARAVALSPADAEIRYRHAQSCFETRRSEETLRALDGWEDWSGLTPEITANIGQLLTNLGASGRAAAALERLSQGGETDPRATLIHIQVLERTNRLIEARQRLDRLLAGGQAQALGEDLLLTEAQLAEREGRYESASRLYRAALEGIEEFPRRHFQLFKLAKCLDADARHEEAFAALDEAHRSQLAYFALSAPAVSVRGVPTMTITQFGCEAQDVASWDDTGAPSPAESPVFIVAFPRSGTTLLELTLDAHPQLVAMDEQTFLQSALEGLREAGAGYPERMAGLTPVQLAGIRAAYWGRVRSKVQLQPGQRLVDKNPLNILRLPAIRRLFPQARILLAVRHPCDVLWSCYLQHFRSPDFALLCADLSTLAVGYRRTMEFWHRQSELLRPALREVRYESFVTELETQTRGICEFLELPWDERLLTPSAQALSKGYISTPSYSQVVRPVNQKSIGRWRPYRRHFAGALTVLEPDLARWGYAV